MSEKFFNFITVMSHNIPEKERSRKYKIKACFVNTAQFFYFYFIYKLYFFNTIKCLGSGQNLGRVGKTETHIYFCLAYGTKFYLAVK